MTKEESEEVAAVFNGCWPQSKMDALTCTMYAGKFRALDYDDARRAISRLMDTNEFRPSFAEIRKTINRKRNLGAVGALKVHESLALPEAEKREATPHQGVSDLISRLSKDKAADIKRKAADILSGKGAE